MVTDGTLSCQLPVASCQAGASGAGFRPRDDQMMIAGSWQLEAAYWKLATGNWQLATGYWLLATGSWQLAAGSWQLATGNWQLATGNSIITPRCGSRSAPIMRGSR
jgi:hypothetical protein